MFLYLEEENHKHQYLKNLQWQIKEENLQILQKKLGFFLGANNAHEVSKELRIFFL